MSTATLTMSDSDPAQFLKIAGQGAGLSTHADLWRWLQGDVQQWLAHEVMLIGWGDFRSGELHYDIISSLAGMRSHHWDRKAIAPLISYFRDCWAAAQKQPCQIDIGPCTELVPQGQGWTSIESIASMRTALVHGMAGGDTGTERVFAALGAQPVRAGRDAAALKLLVPFIDSALRRLPPAPRSSGDPGRADESAGRVARLSVLSERERQIMQWVAMGKTNPEIGCILCISEFTVKNHMKSIFSKLDVTNRAQAVAKLTRVGVHA